MGKNPELIIKIGANSKPFKDELNSLPAEAEKSIGKIGKIAALGGVAAIAALAAGAAAAVQEFKNFEKGFSDVITLLDAGSFKTKNLADGIDSLKQGVIDLRAETGQSFEVLNKGLFDLVSAGIDAENAISVLGVATDLALAGATDASTAVDGLTSAINAYGFESENAREIAEKFFTAQKFGKTTIAELSNGFGQVGASAAALGVSFDEVLASVSAATLAGVKTSEAYTGLKAVLTNIIKPSEDAQEEAAALGIEFNSTGLRAQGLQKFLEGITSSSGFTSTSLEKLFGSAEAVNIALALAGNQADDFEGILNSLNDETSRAETFQAGLSAKSETLDQKLARLEGSASALKAEIGEGLAPAFGLLADSATDGVDAIRVALKTLDSSIQSTFANLTALQRKQIDFLTYILGETDPLANNFTAFDPSAALDDALGGQRIDPFEALTQSAQKYAENGKKLIEESVSDLKIKNQEEIRAEQEKQAAIDEEKNKGAQRDSERAKQKAEAQAERDAAEKIREEEKRQEQLDREDEQFAEDIERLNDRLTGIDEVESQFSGLRELRELKELKTKAKTAEQKQAIDRQTALATQKASDAATMTALDNLQTVFSEETAVGKAIFLIRKAQAIANVITSTQQAMALARATVPPPAGEALAARYAIAGAVNVGVIAATAITGAAEGGIVQGGSFGRDTQPFMLAKDEIIVPSRLNPLSPNFDETFGGGGIGGQSVKVEIGLEDNASKILTVRQREDRALGVQR